MIRTSRGRVLLLAVLLALVAPASLTAEPDLEDRVREIAAELRCPVCDNLSVADSPADLAREMRGVIREQLQAGKTPDEIRQFFLAKYGDWILLSPRARGLGWLVWVAPFAAAAVGVGVALAAVRRWARRPLAGDRPVLDPALVERVRREAAADLETPWPANPEDLSPLELERRRLYAALQELDFDHRSGKLSTTDYTAMRQEYELRAASVLAELDSAGEVAAPAGAAGASRPASPAPASGRGRRGWQLAAGGAFLLVFGITLGYFLTASLRPRMGERDSITGDFLTGTGPGGIAPSSGDAARHLPMLLASARTAYERGDFAAAIESYKQVLAVDRQQPEALTALGLILLQGGHADQAVAAIDQALATAPRDRFALWAKGLALFEGKADYAGAISAWETLMAQGLSDTEAVRVSAMLAEARGRMAAGGPQTPPSRAPTSSIRGTVTLDRVVGQDRPPGGALFIIARRGDGPPIAVKRIPSPAFPASFSLGPEDRMLGDGEFEGELTLIARFKRDGAAGPARSGDLEGRAPSPVKAGSAGVQIALRPVSTLPAAAVPETADIHHVHGLAFDPMDGETLIVATHTGLFRLEGARAPRRIGDHRFDLMGFTADARGGGGFYASGHPDVPTYAREGVGNLGLLVSRDRGATWQSVALKGRADFHALAYSPHEGGRLYGWSVTGETGLHRIAMRTWRVERLRGEGLRDVLALAASPTEPGVLIAGTERGAWVSRDHGETWQPLRQLPPRAAVPAVAYEPDDGRVIYAYVHAPGEGLRQSRDGGDTWQRLGFVPRSGTPVVALAAGRSGRLALATSVAAIARSVDGGRTWETLVEGTRQR